MEKYKFEILFFVSKSEKLINSLNNSKSQQKAIFEAIFDLSKSKLLKYENETTIKYNNFIINYNFNVLPNNHEMDSKTSKTIIYDLEFNSSNIDELNSFYEVYSTILNESVLSQEIWNDIKQFYAKKVYPDIMKTENKLRLLISKFMYSNSIIDWEKERTSLKVKDTIKDYQSNILYSLDFIQLTKFLSSTYAIKPIGSLSYKTKEEISKITPEQWENYIPKSNWDRYFRKYTTIKNNDLDKLWSDLYEMRNKVAHSRGLDKNDYDKTVNLLKESNELIDNLFTHISEIEIPQKNYTAVLNQLSVRFVKLKESDLKMFKEKNPTEMSVQETNSTLYDLICYARKAFEEQSFITSSIYIQRSILSLPCFDLLKYHEDDNYALLGTFMVTYIDDNENNGYNYIFFHNSGSLTTGTVYTREFIKDFIKNIIDEINLIV